MQQVFILCLLASGTIEIEDDFPDITDLFNIPQEVSGPPTQQDARRHQAVKNKKKYLFDFGKVDMNEFDRVMEKLSVDIKKSGLDVPGAHIEEQTLSNFRRQVLPPPGNNKKAWDKASNYLVLQKLLDNMLTLVFMARYRVKELELHPKFDSRNPYYRFAFLFVSLNRYRLALHTIWSSMELISRQTPKQESTSHQEKKYFTNRNIGLHGRAMVIHSDFTYMWWVFVRLHETFCNKTHIFMTKPTTSTEKTTTTL